MNNFLLILKLDRYSTWKVFENEFKNCLLIENIEHRTIKAMALFTLLRCLYKESKNIGYYTTDIQLGRCQVVPLDEQTHAGHILLKAKQLLLDVLGRKDSLSKKLLRYYQLLNVPQPNLEELSDNYLDEESKDEEIHKVIEDVKQIFPKLVVTFPFIGTLGCIVFTGHIFIRESLLDNTDEVAIVTIMFLFIHELDHLKKYLQSSIGTKLEKHTFGGKPNLLRIHPGFADAIIQSTVTEEQWNDIILGGESKPDFTSTKQNKYSSILEEEEDENPEGVILCGTDFMCIDRKKYKK